MASDEDALLNRATSDEDLDILRRRELFDRGADTWEVAKVIVSLASDHASCRSGGVARVSGQHS